MSPPAGRTVPQNRWDLLDGLQPTTPSRVSVVVVHFRQPAQLRRTLAALARQTHPDLEVIVVDDGSPTPPTVPPGVRLLVQEDRGFRAAAARNLGAAHATGEVLCFLDADTAPEPGYVEALARLPALAPEAVTVGRRRHADLAAAPADRPVERAGPAHALPAPAWLSDGYRDSRDLLDADERSYRFVIGAVLACSAWLFAELGGVAETFADYGGEDWEWAHRAWQAGALLAHVPEAVAWHDGPDFAGRDSAPARRAAKLRETLTLARAIPVPGSRPQGLWSGAPAVEVVQPDDTPPAAAVVCADALLAALPSAAVRAPAAVQDAFPDDPRLRAGGPGAPVRVELAQAARVRGDGLAAAVARVGREDLGSLTLRAADGRALARITSARARARIARWGDATLFPHVDAAAVGLAPLEDGPDLEAHLGGWG